MLELYTQGKYLEHQQSRSKFLKDFDTEYYFGYKLNTHLHSFIQQIFIGHKSSATYPLFSAFIGMAIQRQHAQLQKHEREEIIVK